MAYTGTLQRHRGTTVINTTELGRAIRQRCRAASIQALLPDFGLMDGGCLALAKAVQQVLGRQRCTIRYVVANGIPQHAVACVLTPAGAVCIDADGIGTEADVMAKMTQLEGVSGTTTMAKVSDAAARRHGITDPGQLSVRLASLLINVLTNSFIY